LSCAGVQARHPSTVRVQATWFEGTQAASVLVMLKLRQSISRTQPACRRRAADGTRAADPALGDSSRCASRNDKTLLANALAAKGTSDSLSSCQAPARAEASRYGPVQATWHRCHAGGLSSCHAEPSRRSISRTQSACRRRGLDGTRAADERREIPLTARLRMTKAGAARPLGGDGTPADGNETRRHFRMVPARLWARGPGG
jgi:hypothetical protein